MPPRAPTPRQREVLEAMSDRTALRSEGRGWFLDDGERTPVSDDIVSRLVRGKWIKFFARGHYVITEAGRRAVAREDGGV